ncbi:MAG: sensor histidine kinase [Shinella sp.]|nr:MAG: sensor histidine kinase [Shinella sp.]
MTDHASDDCGIRNAHLIFSTVYWGGALLTSAILYIVKINDFSEYIWHTLYLAEKCVRYGSGWAIACVISYALFSLNRWARNRGPSESALPVFIVAAFLISLVAAPSWGAFGYVAQTVLPLPQLAAPDWNGFVNDTAMGAALFFGWSCLFICLVFSFELHDRGRRLAAAREEALSSQMRALRYQVNPHFLFNTMNSIAGLIEEGETGKAQRMTLSLSTFLRTTLSLDPMQDVALSDEVALQEEYLAIERERFSDRMTLRIDITEDARSALVPSLILQPLIENAIKHGVSATVGRVEIAFCAKRENDRLVITMENDMPMAQDQIKVTGVGVGLRNVADRLRACFDNDNLFSAGPIAPGRYRALLSIPWVCSKDA